jgi:hypothetical protein
MDEIRDNNVSITGLPFFGEHADLDIQTKLAWLVKIGPHAFLFAADSCNIEPRLYEHIHREVGDVGCIVSWYGMRWRASKLALRPLLTQRVERAMDESSRVAGSNYEQSKSIVDLFHCGKFMSRPWARSHG